MLNEDKPIEKVYYTIGEVAAMFNLTVSNIRFWETEFDILMPKKNARGDRFFTKKDIENLRMIHYLLKERGYTISGAKKKLKESKNEIQDRLDMIKNLEKIKSFLIEMKNELDKRQDTEKSVTVTAITETELKEVSNDPVAEVTESPVTDLSQVDVNTGTVSITKEDALNKSVEKIKSEEDPIQKKSLPPISPDLFSSQPKEEKDIHTGHMPGDEDWFY